MTSKAAIAHKLHTEILGNVDDFYADRVTYDEFGTRNRAIWDRATRYGVVEAVSALIRNDSHQFNQLTEVVA